MQYREVMWAEQHPDVYDGPDCDQIRPDWYISGEGDKGPPEGGNDTVELAANTFPPGTKIVISVPLCPECEDTADMINDANKCIGCGFDWNEWARIEYA